MGQDEFIDLLPLSLGYFDRSAHMRKLHRQGRYVGTSKIGLWNQSEEKRHRMEEIRKKNAKDKSSTGYGSEYKMRVDNRNLLYNKFQGRSGYIYFLEFPKSIKVGFSKNWERRTTKQILGGLVKLIISGPTKDLADLEFNTFIKYQDYTQLDQTKTRYTEFLDKEVKDDVYDFLLGSVRENKKLKIEVKNPL